MLAWSDATGASWCCRLWVKWLVIACVLGTLASAVVHACRRERPIACDLPPRDCGGDDCGDLVQFLPSVGPGYEDDYVAGEDSSIWSTTYARRDLVMLVKYAAARVACDAADWRTGNGAPIALGDASDVDGNTPGTAYGRPRHPRGSHDHGYDIDIAYYQRGVADNRIRPVCPTGDGMDTYRCVKRPDTLDAKRTALFIGTLFESDRVRIIGVDGMVAKPVHDQIKRLCARGVLTTESCARIKLGYETERTGRLWYYSHHNHLHLSLKR